MCTNPHCPYRLMPIGVAPAWNYDRLDAEGDGDHDQEITTTKGASKEDAIGCSCQQEAPPALLGRDRRAQTI